MTALIAYLKSWRRQKPLKCVILGAGWSGKTTLLYKYKLGEVVSTFPTNGFNCESVERGQREIIFWDFGGCDRIAPLARHLMDNEVGVLFLVDVTADPVTSEFSYELLDIHVRQLLDAGACFFWIILSKQDLLPLEERDLRVSELQARYEEKLKAYGDQLRWKIFAEPGLNILDDVYIWPIFDEIAESLYEQRKSTEIVPKQQKEPERFQIDPSLPTEGELRARIKIQGSDDISAALFWQNFCSASLAAWNHRNHLRAGYMIYLNTLASMGSIWDAAEIFLTHLQRLSSSNPERFRNTQHWTMTLFWLHHLRLAILRYRDDKKAGQLPHAEDFQGVLLHSPSLMNGRLWQLYYTKDLLFSQEAKEYWRLPDLQPLPDYIPVATAPERLFEKRSSPQRSDRLARLGYAVVQRYMTTNERRGLIVKQALQTQQSLNMRLRAKDPSIPPYSETQCYFWIQITHAACAGLSDRNETNSSIKPLLSRLTYESFIILFPELSNTDLWKFYYTYELWSSIPARMSFVNPDLQPLPNIINEPTANSVIRAANHHLNTPKASLARSVSSLEEMTFRAGLTLSEALALQQPVSDAITAHSQLLLNIYTRFVTGRASGLNSSRIFSKVLDELSGPSIPGLTSKAFWTQLVMAAFFRTSSTPGSSTSSISEGFTKLIDENTHLAWEELPSLYYSPETWNSYDAQTYYVAPDRQKLPKFFSNDKTELETSLF